MTTFQALHTDLLQHKRPRVLVISEFFPNPIYPALGIFVERQTKFATPYADFVVVSPIRVFPHMRILAQLPNPRNFQRHWLKWQQELKQIPNQMEWNGIPTYYPRYTSMPKQIFHSTWGYTAYPFLKPLLKRLHKEHQFDLIHAHYAIPCGTIALLAQRWMKCPVAVSIHGTDVTYTAHQHTFAENIVRSVFQRVDQIIVQSSWTAKRVYQFGGSPEKTKLVRLGANPPEIYNKSSVKTDTRAETSVVQLLTVANLEERKQHTTVIKAVARLLEKGFKIHYTIVGSGPNLQRLRELVSKLELKEHVTFAGYKAHEEVWPYFEQCDIFVLPSVQEAFGVVYIEALSMGKPVIGCYGEGGPEDLKQLGDCIALVEPQNVDSLESALTELISQPDRRSSMGAKGQQIVYTYYNWTTNAEEMIGIYHQMIKTSAIKKINYDK